MFLFAIPAGALADIVNKRIFLIIGKLSITIATTVFAGSSGLILPRRQIFSGSRF
jgi:Transmembrane secretion effector